MNKGSAVALGVGVGVAMGVALHNIAVGMGIGVAMWLAFSASSFGKRPRGRCLRLREAGSLSV